MKHQTGKTTLKKKNGEDYVRKFDYEYFDRPELAFIDPDRFEKIGQMLRNSNNKGGENSQVYSYLFDKGKVICGVCPRNYFPYKRTINGKLVSHLYMCSSKRYYPCCGNSGIDIDKLDKLIQAVIFDKHSLMLKENLNNESLKADISKFTKEIKRFQSELEKELKNESLLVDIYTRGRINLQMFVNKQNISKSIQKNIEEKIVINKRKLSECKDEYSNFIDIKKLEYNFNRKNENLPKSTVNKIITNIKLTKISSAPKMFQDICEQMKKKEDVYFRNKQEQIILVEIISGISKYYYFIGQREKAIFDLQDSSFKFPFAMGFKGFKQYLPLDNLIEEQVSYKENERFIISNKYLTEEELELQLAINKVDSLYDELNKYVGDNEDDD